MYKRQELTIHALSHSYGDKKALTDFTHTFTPGITALLGPNGAGKSTLKMCIRDRYRWRWGRETA